MITNQKTNPNSIKMPTTTDIDALSKRASFAGLFGMVHHNREGSSATEDLNGQGTDASIQVQDYGVADAGPDDIKNGLT